MPKITTNLNLNPNQIIIDHKELKEIYKRFKNIDKNNSNETTIKRKKTKNKINFISHEYTNEINIKK